MREKLQGFNLIRLIKNKRQNITNLKNKVMKQRNNHKTRKILSKQVKWKENKYHLNDIISRFKDYKQKILGLKSKLSYEENIKEPLAFLLSIVGLILLSPLMLVIAVMIKLNDGGSVLFCQERLGKDLKPFRIYKFRTLKTSSEKDKSQGILLEGDSRITKVGAFLRKTSLDELPQLVNILLGDMTIIGPRPITREEYLPYENVTWVLERFQKKPGLFCTVDIKHRASATREQQFKLDVDYVRNISFFKDLIIFLKVFVKVLSRKNVYPTPKKEDHTMCNNPRNDEEGDKIV